MPAPLRPDEPEGIPLESPLYQKEMAAMQQQEAINAMAAGAPIYHGNVVDHRPTVSEQLAMRKAHLEAELKQVNEAIAHALANTPTMALLDSIAKVGLHR